MSTELFKLHPPAPEILLDKPYQNDLFGRNKFGDSLTSLFRNVEESVVLCIDAKWGDGKTTFAKMWTTDLKRQGIHCIYFDTFEHDYADDPFVAFCAEIIQLTGAAFPQSATIQRLRDEFKAQAIALGGKLLCASARTGCTTLPRSAANTTACNARGDGKDNLAANTLNEATDYMERAIEERLSGRNVQDDFRRKLSELGAAVREAQKFPILLIVDELDRCRPDFAMSMIERIKHLFNVSNVSFALLANTAQLESCVKLVYGAEVDARNYLHKFFTLGTKLPGNYLDRGANDRAQYSRRLIKHFGIDPHGETIITILVPLFDYHKFTLREMEQCFSLLAVYYSQLPKSPTPIDPVIALLALTWVRFPVIADKLSASKMSYKDLAARLGIDSLPDSIPLSNFPNSAHVTLSSILKYLLFNTLEYEAVGKEDPLRTLFPYFQSIWQMERTRIIPHLCDEIGRFRMENG